jgi:predicted phage tail protein
MFIQIKLNGALGKRFGKVHRCIAANAAQAMRYMEVNYSDFRDWILNASERGILFNVKINNSYELGEEEIIDPLPESATITITPLFAGAGGGNINWLKVLVGGGLLALGLFGVGFLGLSPLQMMITGGLLLISGLLGGKVPPSDEEETRSFVFSGATNTVQAGGRVPVVYGIIQTGSIVISAAVRSYLVSGGGPIVSASTPSNPFLTPP